MVPVVLIVIVIIMLLVTMRTVMIELRATVIDSNASSDVALSDQLDHSSQRIAIRMPMMMTSVSDEKICGRCAKEPLKYC